MKAFQNISPILDNQMKLNSQLDDECAQIKSQNEKIEKLLIKKGIIEEPKDDSISVTQLSEGSFKFTDRS